MWLETYYFNHEEYTFVCNSSNNVKVRYIL